MEPECLWKPQGETIEPPVQQAPAKDPIEDSTPKIVNEKDEKLIKSTNMVPLQTTKLPVSLVFKRTCYKCGSLGHFANECSSNERLCYNCKTPGHESSECPNDRNSESKQCYFCRDVGHIQSECPKYQQIKKDQPKRSRQGNEQYNSSNIGAQNYPNYLTMSGSPYQSPYYPDGMMYQPWVYQQPYTGFYSPHSISPQEMHESSSYFKPQFQGQDPYYYSYEAPPPGYLQYDTKQAFHYHTHSPQNSHFYQHQPHHYQHQSEQFTNLIQLRSFGNQLQRVNSGKQQKNCYECGQNGHEVSFQPAFP